MAEAELKVNVTAAAAFQIAAVARPGDTIMLGFARTVDNAELERLMEDFEGFTEATGVHIAFVEQVSSMAVVRPGEERGRTTTLADDNVDPRER